MCLVDYGICGRFTLMDVLAVQNKNLSAFITVFLDGLHQLRFTMKAMVIFPFIV